MNVKIWPHKPGDGGIMCMPLQRNIPTSNNSRWTPASCPICGAACWETDLHRSVRAQEKDIVAYCTECALRSSQEGADHAKKRTTGRNNRRNL